MAATAKIHIPGELDRTTGVQKCTRCKTRINFQWPAGWEPSKWAVGRAVIAFRRGMQVASETEIETVRACGRRAA